MKSNIRWSLAQALEIKWWKRYLTDKNPDSYLIWKKDYWLQLIQELKAIHLEPGSVVLDAGCGPAGIFIALDDAQVSAIDPLLDKYKDLPHFQPNKFPHVQFKTQTIESLDAQQKFDAVFCLNAINHVADIDVAYDRLCDAVKDDGWLIVSIDAHKSQLLKRIFKVLPGDVLHPHQYDLKDYEGFLTERGFKIEQTLLKTPGRIFDYYVQVAKKNV